MTCLQKVPAKACIWIRWKRRQPHYRRGQEGGWGWWGGGGWGRAGGGGKPACTWKPQEFTQENGSRGPGCSPHVVTSASAVVSSCFRLGWFCLLLPAHLRSAHLRARRPKNHSSRLIPRGLIASHFLCKYLKQEKLSCNKSKCLQTSWKFSVLQRKDKKMYLLMAQIQ